VDPGEEDGLEIVVPDELQAGVYAQSAVLWHTQHDFTLDFLVYQDLTLLRLVGRVRIPTTLIFELLQGLNATMTDYETEFGEIKRVEPRDEEEGH
jgi:hypothetical protein